MAGPLIAVLRDVEACLDLTATEWTTLLAQARDAMLGGHLAARLQAAGLDTRLDARLRHRLGAEAQIAAHNARAIRWEVNRVRRAFFGLDVPVLLLKGAAYAAADVPIAAGRICGDLDILVPKTRLAEVEARLTGHGWEPVKLDPYDQRYYRDWMHELPPLYHPVRRMVIDVHHTLLPETSRLRLDRERLLRAAVPLADGGMHVLAPADMVLHAAIHLFHDGDLSGGLRDLVDIDGLLRHFGGRAGFWPQLVLRAGELGLGRPLFHALRYGARILATPVPTDVAEAVDAYAPSPLARRAMDALAVSVLTRRISHDPTVGGAAAARLALLVRAHWLKMPPGLLAGHLLRKSAFRLRRPRPA